MTKGDGSELLSLNAFESATSPLFHYRTPDASTISPKQPSVQIGKYEKTLLKSRA
jgi:hypothetical protein